MNEKIDIIEIEEETKDIFEETYDLLNNQLNTIEKLNTKSKDYEILKIKYETLEENYKKLEKKYNNKTEALEKEIKNIKRNNMGQDKKIVMLKTLLEIILKKYGIESVSRVTRLNKEQIEKYLN